MLTYKIIRIYLSKSKKCVNNFPLYGLSGTIELFDFFLKVFVGCNRLLNRNKTKIPEVIFTILLRFPRSFRSACNNCIIDF